MLNQCMLNALRQIAVGLAKHFGNDCEVVVHDLDTNHLDNSIIVIENGHVSHRKRGDGPSHVVLEAIKHDPKTLDDNIGYISKTHDGRILRCSTIYIRDEDGKVSAILAINYDITNMLAAEKSIHSLISIDTKGSQPNEPKTIPLNVNDLLDQLIQQSIQLIGKPVALMTKDDKVRAIQFLNNTGAFLITKSGDKISKEFGISKYTLYSYLDASKSE